MASSSLLVLCLSASPSKFRGVIWLRSGKWGARIAYKYKAYWLGTYDIEQEAAMAYDRAAIKLQRSDTPLNFPMSNYSVEETKFLGRHSNEAVLAMIKDKSYRSKYANFVSNQALLRHLESSNNFAFQQPGVGVTYQMLFRKELTQTDVTHIKGFHIPKDHAIDYFPPLANSRDGNNNSSIELTFFDKHYRPWTFRYSYWKSTQTFVFTKGWRHFLKMNGLNTRDSVVFYKCEMSGNMFYMIDMQRNCIENCGVRLSVAEQELGKRKRSEEVEEEIAAADRTSNGVMLFGVEISNGGPNHKRRIADE
ncbi:AP2/ERF and B3 domain-containing transcription factor At1g50680-like [Mercurialis annua]|uniref:AP2/ERF and B3 domain-containing transcription factor At1g50680-like n=1 Tax=Mercurialis annua TaxID=3986 RepID=UPI00215F0752|nr:AP2/ERF and B3 domain-containing transcription factor At1g50680-like [Mercurialis annua]